MQKEYDPMPLVTDSSTLAPNEVNANCRNPSFGLATKAKGNCKGAGQEEARELSQEEAWESRQKEARESHHILTGVQENARECEGVNTHTPKATPTWGDGVPVDS